MKGLWIVFVLLAVLVSGCSLFGDNCVKECKAQLSFVNVTCNQGSVEGYQACLSGLEQSSYQLNNLCENRCRK